MEQSAVTQSACCSCEREAGQPHGSPHLRPSMSHCDMRRDEGNCGGRLCVECVKCRSYLHHRAPEDLGPILISSHTKSGNFHLSPTTGILAFGRPGRPGRPCACLAASRRAIHGKNIIPYLKKVRQCEPSKAPWQLPTPINSLCTPSAHSISQRCHHTRPSLSEPSLAKSAIWTAQRLLFWRRTEVHLIPALTRQRHAACSSIT